MTTRIDLNGNPYSTEGNLNEVQSSESDFQRIVMPEVGNIIEWTEFDSDLKELISFRADVIKVKGQLWANGCGSVETIQKCFGFEIVEA